MATINRERDLDRAFSRAHAEGKFVLLDFFSRPEAAAKQ
jgi:hypothetical protein